MIQNTEGIERELYDDWIIDNASCNQINYIERVIPSDEPFFPKSLAYTSFDGDHMQSIMWMCGIAQHLGFVPVNPEAALGYYLCTTSHNNSKIEVMRDCLALELLCKELWIFRPTIDSHLQNLAEGVVAELILWRNERRHDPIRFFPWIGGQTAFSHRLLPSSKMATLKDALCNEGEVDRELEAYAPEFKNQLNEKLLALAEKEGLRPTAFISLSPTDFKHIDWARLTAYHNGYVPLTPDLILNPFVAETVYGSESSIECPKDRLSLLAAADELWIFHRPNISLKSNLADFSLEVVCDLAFWLRERDFQSVKVLSWLDAGVPKFSQENAWSITMEEHLKNLDYS